MAPATRRKCKFRDCDYLSEEGLATQELVMRDLEMHVGAEHPIQVHQQGSQQIKPAVLVKEPPVPSWTEGLEIEDYIQNIRDWAALSGQPEKVKVQLIIENLEKNNQKARRLLKF